MTPTVLALAGVGMLGLGGLCLSLPRLIDHSQIAAQRRGLAGDDLARFDSRITAAKSRLPMYARLLIGLGVASLLVSLAIGNLA
jgi:hypothetical protein